MMRHYFPSFSIIIESENLAVADSAVLFRALDSLFSQTIPVSRANEAILVNSGRIPADVEQEISERYPSLRLHTMDSGTTYYQAKQGPVSLTTGEVIVFCDCDCSYAPAWLESLLRPYVDPQIAADVVTGETSIVLTGFYSYLISLSWCFPPYSNRKSPYRTDGYAANNVSFRRSVLDRTPIPTGLRLYRGNCSLHARELNQQGIDVWKAPGARAGHPTLRFRHLPARYFMWGHHEAKVCLARHRGNPNPWRRAAGILGTTLKIASRRLAMPFIRWPSLLIRRPTSVFYIPPLLCGIAIAYLLFVIGMLTTVVYPPMSLLRWASALEGPEQQLDA